MAIAHGDYVVDIEVHVCLFFHERAFGRSIIYAKFDSLREVGPYTIYALVIFNLDTIYLKTCVKWPLKNRQNKDLNDKW